MVDVGAYGKSSDGGTLCTSDFGKALHQGTLYLRYRPPPPKALSHWIYTNLVGDLFWSQKGEFSPKKWGVCIYVQIYPSDFTHTYTYTYIYISCSLRGPNPTAWDILKAIPSLSEESAKKGVNRWREEIWDAVAGGELYSQTPLPFWEGP